MNNATKLNPPHRQGAKRVALAGISLLLVLGVLLPGQARAQSLPCADTVIVQAGDTLSAIALRTLGSLSAYPHIVTATNAAAETDARFPTITDPGAINVGWTLCIPAASTDTASGSGGGASDSTPAAETGAGDNTAADEPEYDFDGARLTIDYLRSLDFPGSELVIEQTLAPGDNYARYVASYQSEGFKIFGLLTVPNGDAPAGGWPAIIFNHGYIPPEVYRTTERYVAYQDGFARNGYVTFKSDYRGHGFSEGDARSSYGTPDYVIDVLNATASVKQLPYVDADRIGMWGHSMGGYITVRAMLADPDIKVGVIWAGVVAAYPDIMTRWTRTSVPRTIPSHARRWRDELQAEYGTPEENPEFWASISANTFVDELPGPIQLHHGTADGSVPLLFSELLRDDIEAAGGEVELFSYAGDDHNLSQSFNTAMARSVAFFDEVLK
ncbi:MAG: alpha/beta fold hydrolase [Caldilineaceae bacterium]|nr:alpha/beta fold hydrolase [Caldilineaceae bacterium]